jgi:hypothetical protein
LNAETERITRGSRTTLCVQGTSLTTYSIDAQETFIAICRESALNLRTDALDTGLTLFAVVMHLTCPYVCRINTDAIDTTLAINTVFVEEAIRLDQLTGALKTFFTIPTIRV